MMSSVDFYRRVPKDLTEVRRHSIACCCNGWVIYFHVGFYEKILRE